MRVLVLMLLFVGVSFGQFDASPLRDLAGDIDAARPSKPLCTVPVSDSPLVRGKFRLGMSRADYDKPIDPPKRTTPFLLDVSADPETSNIPPDISLIPTFFEDRLIRIRVSYHSDVKWDAVAEFAYVIASEFGLPPQAWRSNGSLGLVMFCDGWLILAEPNRIELRDEIGIKSKVKADAAARSAEAEEKKKRFKP
jgi:hypothetical protein